MAESGLTGEIKRYVGVGLVNAAVTPAAFFGLSHVMTPSLAFTIVYFGVIRILEGADLERWAITLGTVAVTSPLSFVGTRLMARRSAR